MSEIHVNPSERLKYQKLGYQITGTTSADGKTWLVMSYAGEEYAKAFSEAYDEAYNQYMTPEDEDEDEDKDLLDGIDWLEFVSD